MDGQRKKERNRNLDRLLFECVIKNAPTNDIERESVRERERERERKRERGTEYNEFYV